MTVSVSSNSSDNLTDYHQAFNKPVTVGKREIGVEWNFGSTNAIAVEEANAFLDYLSENEMVLRMRLIAEMSKEENSDFHTPCGRSINPGLFEDVQDYTKLMKLTCVDISTRVRDESRPSDVEVVYELLYESGELYGDWSLSGYFNSKYECEDFGTHR